MVNFFVILSFVLISLVILVNGWTDAPNAVTSCIVTNTLSYKKCIILSAIFNFLGLFIMSMISHSVIDTISNIVSFPSNNDYSIIAVCAGMISVVFWSVFTWYFGIPTSESHALISGITGAALALNSNISTVNINEWIKVLIGLIISSLLGILLANVVFSKVKNMRCNTSKLQIFFTMLLSFFHGAQDGQKFIGIFLILFNLLNISFVKKWNIIMILYCSIIMMVGTLMGGKKIINKIGVKLVNIDKREGLTIDIVSSLCIMFATLFGIPLSTTHVRTFAVCGVGMSNKKQINKKVIKEVLLVWIITFPCCIILGYLFSLIILKHIY